MDLKNALANHKSKKTNQKQKENRVESVSELFGGNDEGDLSILLDEAKSQGRLISLPASKFKPDPSQPRKTFNADALEHLQIEIETIGQLQPIVVRPVDNQGNHMIIAGERRWRAVRASKKVEILDAVIVTSELDELLVLRMQIQENDNRENVNALESAASIMRGVDLCKEHSKSTDDKSVSKYLGISATSISKSRGILGASDVIKALSEDNVIQDADTLYELSKAYKKDSAATEAFIEDIRSNDVEGNVRKASKRLDAELKEKHHEEKNIKNKGSKSTSKSKKGTKKMPVVEDVCFDSDGDKIIISLSAGKTVQDFVLSETAIKRLTNKYCLKLES